MALVASQPIWVKMTRISYVQLRDESRENTAQSLQLVRRSENFQATVADKWVSAVGACAALAPWQTTIVIDCEKYSVRVLNYYIKRFTLLFAWDISSFTFDVDRPRQQNQSCETIAAR